MSGNISGDDWDIDSRHNTADSNGIITWYINVNNDFDPEGQYTHLNYWG